MTNGAALNGLHKSYPQACPLLAGISYLVQGRCYFFAVLDSALCVKRFLNVGCRVEQLIGSVSHA
jgi:hypothetical protein